MSKIRLTVLLCSILLCTSCATRTGTADAGYTAEELDNLAELELYLPGEDTPAKVIRDEKILYQYNHCASSCDEASDTEERQEELEETVEGAAEKFRIVSYKFPVSRVHKKELIKNMTVTVYEDTLDSQKNAQNIIKTEISEESVKGIPVPAEFLTFYSEISEEEMAFYHSLLGN